MHIVLLDPGLQAPIGHHYNLDRGLVGEFRRAGVPYRLLVNRAAAAELVAELGAEPHFDFYPYRRVSEDPMTRDLEDYLHLNEVVLKDLAGLAGRVDLADTLVVVHTATNRLLWGMAMWLAQGQVPPSMRVALVLPHASGLVAGVAAMDAVLYRHAFIQLRRVADRIRLLTLADPQAEEYRFLSALPVDLVPYPNPASSWWPALRDRPRPPGERCRVLFCGEATARKGFHLLSDIIRRTSELRNDVEFVVQVNGWHVDTGRADAFESFAAARDDVHLVRGFLKEQAYYELVADADVMLLPYQDSVYISGTSAVFEEAMYLGRPVVAPPRLLMASQLAPFPDAGRVAASLEADAFADAIAQVVTDYPRFAAGAARAGEAWRSQTGIDRFARTIVALATTRS